MPENDVELVGRFEKETYTVTYQFQGNILPPNADTLLPEVKSYEPGEVVKLAENPEAAGYRFLGWYANESFEMPNKNIIIYGEWAEQAGMFSPTITQEIINPKEKYEKGDTVEFKITITNPENFQIKDVILENKYTLVAGVGYTLMNNHYVKIPSIPANSSIEVYGRYTVEEDNYQKLENVAEIIGVIADNNYVFDTSKDYQSKVEFLVGKINLKINKIDKDNNSLSGAVFELYEDKSLSKEIKTGLEFNDLEVNKTYYLKELKAPDGYVLSDHITEIIINENGKVMVDGNELSITDGFYKIDIINEKQNFINSPDTIDSIITYILLFILSIGIIAFVIFKLKKDNHQRPKKSNQKKEEEIDLI